MPRSPAHSRQVNAVFLDRDGTLNVKAPEGYYVTDPQKVVLIPGAAKAVARLNRAGLRTVLVTNQRWLSTAGAVHQAFRATQLRLVELLAAEGAWLDAMYHCPHASFACSCRKPAPGMLHQAAWELGLELTQTVIVGDSISDMAAGRAVGAGTILVNPSSGQRSSLIDCVAPELNSAVDRILARCRSGDTYSNALRSGLARPRVRSEGDRSGPGRSGDAGVNASTFGVDSRRTDPTSCSSRPK